MATPNLFANKTGSVLLKDLDENFEYVDNELSTLQSDISQVQTNLDNVYEGNPTFTGNVTFEGNPSFTGNVTFEGLTTLQEITEVLNTKTGATGVVAHDFSTGGVFYHTSLAANFTANITNVPTTNDRSISIALVLIQGSTAYIPSALQINGSAVTIKWADAEVPNGNANQVDVISFSLIRSGSAWTVLGVLNTFG